MHQLGSRSGVLFRAVVENDLGDPFRVNFLLSETDLKRGKEIIRGYLEEDADGSWEHGTGRIPVPALYDFADLRSSHSR